MYFADTTTYLRNGYRRTKNKSVSEVQFLDDAVCDPLRAYAVGKGTDPFFSPAIGKE